MEQDSHAAGGGFSTYDWGVSAAVGEGAHGFFNPGVRDGQEVAGEPVEDAPGGGGDFTTGEAGLDCVERAGRGFGLAVDCRLIETVCFDGFDHHEVWAVAGAALVEAHEDCGGDAAYSALHKDMGDVVWVWNLGEGFFHHHHVGIHDVARDGGGEVVPGGAADEVPVV